MNVTLAISDRRKDQVQEGVESFAVRNIPLLDFILSFLALAPAFTFELGMAYGT
jgi:hypothetical protein